ncbi:MAG: hypothetical protein ACRDY5_06920, partial [Acidimicrobiales bacterium]
MRAISATRVVAAVAVVITVMATAPGARAQVPIVFGSSFGSAPVVGPGVYTDVIQRLEQLYVAVDLQDGQHLEATATLVGQPEGPDGNPTAANLFLIGTKRVGYRSGLKFWDGRVDVVVDASSPTVGDPFEPDPGRQYVRLDFGGGGGDKKLAGRDYMFRLAIEIVQDRPPTPATTTTTTTVSGAPSPAPSTPASPSAQGGAADDGVPLAAGLATFVLGAAGGGTAMWARRRHRSQP